MEASGSAALSQAKLMGRRVVTGYPRKPSRSRKAESASDSAT